MQLDSLPAFYTDVSPAHQHVALISQTIYCFKAVDSLERVVMGACLFTSKSQISVGFLTSDNVQPERSGKSGMAPWMKVLLFLYPL